LRQRPIAGPILACQQFGWLPSILWIGFGVVFIGAVHDVSTLVASVRHDARSIAEVIRENLGARPGGRVHLGRADRAAIAAFTTSPPAFDRGSQVGSTFDQSARSAVASVPPARGGHGRCPALSSRRCGS
jgi:hypothetical protein